MWSKFLKICALSAALSGCGTFVPELRDWTGSGSEAETQEMIQAVVRSVRCELRNAVTSVVGTDVDQSRRNSGRAYADFLDNWGAEVLITFTVVENTTINPTTVLMPRSPMDAVFTLSGGLSQSAKATRIEKMNFFYTVRELYLPKGAECDASKENRNGSLLVQNKLKIATLLDARITAAALGQAGTLPAAQKNVLQHQVTFQIVSSGDITPKWALVRATINPSGSLFKASRDRTHDLLITFGPLDKPAGGKSLIAIAEGTHLSAQISNGVAAAVRAGMSE